LIGIKLSILCGDLAHSTGLVYVHQNVWGARTPLRKGNSGLVWRLGALNKGGAKYIVTMNYNEQSVSQFFPSK